MTSTNQEPTLLEYARFHGVAIDYLSVNPLDGLATINSYFDIDGSLEDLPGLSSFEVPLDIGKKEKFVVDKETAVFLKDVMSAPDALEELDEPVSRALLAESLWIEPPLLRTDSEWGLMHFGTRIAPDLESLRFQPAAVDDEDDEGLEWPQHYLDLPAIMQQKISSERLEIPKNALTFLKDTIKLDENCVDEELVFAQDLGYDLNLTVSHLTPPLLPMSPPMTPFVPTHTELELLSDHDSIFSQEREELGRKIMEQDQLIADPMQLDSDIIADVIGVSSPSFADEMLSDCDVSLTKRKSPCLKVEDPLTPPLITERTLKRLKTVKFADLVHGSETLAAEVEKGDGESSTSAMEDLRMLVDEHIRPLAEIFQKSVENEQLLEPEAVCKLPVPQLKKWEPVPPWKVYSCPSNPKEKGRTEFDSQKRLLEETVSQLSKQHQIWHGSSGGSKRLSWNPFRGDFQPFSVNEKIEADDAIDAVFAGLDLSEGDDGDSLLWLPERMLILEESDDSDEDLEPAKFDQDKGLDLRSLLQIHRTALDQATSNPEQNQKVSNSRRLSSNDPSASLIKEQKKSVRNLNQLHELGFILPEDQMTATLLSIPRSSISIGLARFLETQNIPSMQRSREPTKAFCSEEKAISRRPLQIDANNTESKKVSTSMGSACVLTPSSQAALVAPSLPTQRVACQCIVSASILSAQRLLMREIRKIYPEAEFVGRDFDNVLLEHPAEADIIVSSATGLVLTTLQSIKQRALPGQPAHPGVQARISKVVVRYERLIVLVGDGSTVDCHLLDDSDCAALASLSAFVSCLDGEVQIIYVAGGTEGLAKWIAGVIGRYCISSEVVNTKRQDVSFLQQEETRWELFLRHAGLNAFAANAVLSRLNSPAHCASPSHTASEAEHASESSGLSAFIQMAPEQRIAEFQGVLGGARVLTRLNAVLEQSWGARQLVFGLG